MLLGRWGASEGARAWPASRGRHPQEHRASGAGTRRTHALSRLAWLHISNLPVFPVVVCGRLHSRLHQQHSRANDVKYLQFGSPSCKLHCQVGLYWFQVFPLSISKLFFSSPFAIKSFFVFEVHAVVEIDISGNQQPPSLLLYVRFGKHKLTYLGGESVLETYDYCPETQHPY